MRSFSGRMRTLLAATGFVAALVLHVPGARAQAGPDGAPRMVYAAAHEVDGLVARFIRALNDESVRFLAPFYAPDAVLVAGLSEGDPAPRVRRAILARDTITMLDSLALERAVVAGQWGDLLIHLAEEYPHRIAGLVFLESHDLFEPDAAIQEQDPIGVLRMLELNRAALWGGVLEPADPEPDRGNGYLRPGSRIDVPALSFVGEASSPEAMWDEVVGLARLAERSAALFPEPRTRPYFRQLASDEAMQAQGRAFWSDIVAPSLQARRNALERAFGDRLRMVPVDPRAIGYGYRDTPDVVGPQIRRFLEDVDGVAKTYLTEAVAPRSDTTHVAPPKGENEADRASILAALEQVPTGGTVQFAAGTYLVGEIIRVDTPGITLLGHSEGTVLRGCEWDDFQDMDLSMLACNGLELAGVRQTVRGITFENAFWALHLGCCWSERRMYEWTDGSTFEGPVFRRTGGGHLVENNTFRSASSGVRVNGDWTEPAVVRNNRFIDNWHAVSINGHTVHLLNNHISVPEPARVPFSGFPWDGIKISPPPPAWGEEGMPTQCAGNVIEGNHVEHHLDGIRIEVYFPNTACRDNIVRDNTVVVARHRNPDPAQFNLVDPSDSSFVGVPISLLNEPMAFGEAAPGNESAIDGNVIERNRIVGGEGVGIQVVHASRNRIADNEISGIVPRSPFPGNAMGAWGAKGLAPPWADANGSGVWLSPGSDENEIVGNTFEQVASYAVVVAGDRNRVETRVSTDVVRDLGSGNEISSQTDTGAATGAAQAGNVAADPAAASPYESRFADVRGIRLHYLDFGGAGLPLIFVHDWYEDAHTWTTMAPPLADAHRVLAVTRRGYGQSDDVGWGYDVATQAEDILGFMDALGIDRAVLVGRHPATQDMTWIAEHHPQRLAGLVYLYHAVAPSPGDARILRDRTFAEMFYRYGGCWMGEEAYERAAPRLPYRPHYIDDERRRIDVPALSFTHPQDLAAGMGELDLLDLTLAGATGADPGGGFCDAASIEASVAWLTELARDAERLAAARALVPTSTERRGYAQAFERAFGSNLRVIHLDGPADYRTDPEIYIPHIRSFLAELAADGVAALTARAERRDP